MGIFDTVVNQARKVQLQGEIVLVDRDITLRKNKFGIELYTLLDSIDKEKPTTTKQSSGKNTTTITNNPIKIPSFFCANESLLRIPFHECRHDVNRMVMDRDTKEMEIHHLSSARERSKPAVTNKEYISKATSRVSDAATETKLQYEITMLEKQIRQRKEKFGNEVYDICISSIINNNNTTSSSPSSTTVPNSPNKGKKGSVNPFSNMLGGVSKVVSTLNSTESEIKNCILLAKRDVDVLLKDKAMKEREIDSLTNK